MTEPLSLFRSFRAKILLGYGAALAVTALIFVWSIVNLLTLGRAADSILRENYKSILAAEHMINNIERQDSFLLHRLLDLGRSDSPAFRDMESNFLQWLGRAKDNITIEGEQDILARLESNYLRFLQEAHPLLEGASSAPEHYRERVEPVFLAIRDDCTRLREINQETMIAASDSARVLASRAVWMPGMDGLAVLKKIAEPSKTHAPAVVLWAEIIGMFLGRLEFMIVLATALKAFRALRTFLRDTAGAAARKSNR